METAAQAGCLIYDDPVKIYRESYKALGLTTYPFYEGNILQICDTVQNFNELFEEPISSIIKEIEELRKLDLPSQKEIAKLEERKTRYMSRFMKAINEADHLLGLKLHDAI